MKITNDIKFIGVNDKDITLFEGQYEVKNGMSYNSYVILDEKIAVTDTVEKSFAQQWLDNISKALQGRKPDYLIVHHMEPDHSANIKRFMDIYPEATLVTNDKALKMIKQYFGEEYENRRIAVKEGDTLSLGSHELSFIMAPMVHWPEVMMSYDKKDKVLFSADAFGKFGTIDADEPWEDEAARYYIGIVGKFGPQVQKVLAKAADLDIEIICPLHGPMLMGQLDYYLGLYDTWSSYRPQKKGVVIAYTSIYGNTKAAALSLAEKLREKGAGEVVLHDLTRCDLHRAVADAFIYSHLVLATTTYNGSYFPAMRRFTEALTDRSYQNRTVAFIENGSWAPLAAKLMKEKLSQCKNILFCENTVTLNGAASGDTAKSIELLSEELCGESKENAVENDSKALFKIGYGLYLLTSNDGKKDNGCIVNSVVQLTGNPGRIAVTVNKDNYSHHIIKKTGKMNLCCLSESAPFSVFENFGFTSGRNTDKFKNISVSRSSNGLVYTNGYINSYISLQVEQYVDVESHGMFICSITEARVISDAETMTYSYYFANVKPKPETKNKTGYVCKICGYVYEGEELPADFICPLCKHPAEDFEKIQ